MVANVLLDSVGRVLGLPFKSHDEHENFNREPCRSSFFFELVMKHRTMLDRTAQAHKKHTYYVLNLVGIIIQISDSEEVAPRG